MTSSIVTLSTRLTKNTFPIIVAELFGDKYDLSKTVYLRSVDFVIIICPIHGEVLIRPSDFVRSKYGCPHCGNSAIGNYNAIPFEEFERRAKLSHPDREFIYDKDSYVNYTTSIIIICGECHESFIATPRHHIDNLKDGCPYCSKRARVTEEDYHRVAESRGCKWIGEELPSSVVVKTKWICLQSGHIWLGRYHDLKNWQTCPTCGKINPKPRKHSPHRKYGSGRPLLSFDDFEEKARKVHGFRFLYYRDSYTSSHEKTMIMCTDCGLVFMQRPTSHLNGTGCPACSESKLEKEVAEILVSMNFSFIRQAKFDALIDKGSLRLDFFLEKEMIAIECNGLQHYQPVKCFGGDKKFEDQKRKDQIKRNYCSENGIGLLEIRYDCENIAAEICKRLGIDHIPLLC